MQSLNPFIAVIGGSPAVSQDIADVVEEKQVDQVIMGSRGWSSALGIGVTVGSVSTSVLEKYTVASILHDLLTLT